MRIKAQRSVDAKHRKITTSQTTKGRVALVAIATGAASTAGIGGATAAQLQAAPDEDAEAVDFKLANETEQLSTATEEQSSPQILAISEYKPVSNLDSQLVKAVHASEERAVADAAARGSSVAKPAEGTFTSGYGMRWGSMHAGIDIAAPVGTPIKAVMDGTVISSGPASGYGNWIRIQHDDGSISVYGHMVSLNVSVGERVTAGQHIADMGNEGHSTGPHLHFEIHPPGGGAIDPKPWLEANGIVL